MPARASAHPYVDDWIKSLNPTTAAQYAPRVRAFLASRKELAAATSRKELIAHCASIESRGMRWKATAALDSYYNYCEDRNAELRHPAPNLAKKVSAFIERREIEEALRKAGATRQQARAILWRDVAHDLLHTRSRLPDQLTTAARLSLKTALLEKLRSSTVETVDTVLDARVLD